MSTPIIWLSLHEGIDSRGPWDTGLLEHLFAERLWRVDRDFTHHVITDDDEAVHDLTGPQAVVVLPARHHAEDTDRLNGLLTAFDSVLLILVGDEEAIFPWRLIVHDRMKMWVMLPRPVEHGDLAHWAFFFGDGWSERAPGMIAGDGSVPEKVTQWAFLGQHTNSRRKQAANGLRRLSNRVPGVMELTEGFGQGRSPEDYYAAMRSTKVAPCPGGPCTPDTFRLYEALEAGCAPIVDAISSQGWKGYWDFVYPYDRVPFPVVEDWDTVGGIVEAELADWPRGANLASSWWMRRKREMAYRLNDDLTDLGVPATSGEKVTALITTSPSYIHPSTDHLEETLESVRETFGEHIDVIIACDGVRPEQRKIERDYGEYVRRLCWKSHHEWDNTIVYVAPEWLHQANLTSRALNLVSTDLVLFLEHDTPLVVGEPIDVPTALAAMSTNALDVLRFHHEASILAVHDHLMLDHEPTSLFGLPVQRTIQWSQRPHLATTAYYRRILRENFGPESRTMIEDVLHGVCQSQSSARNRLAIYTPPGTSIKRSYHLDGRGSETKFQMRF